MAQPVRPPVTVDALDSLDGERVEIIDGVIVDEAMTSFAHGDAQSSVAGEIKPRFRDGGGGQPGWWIATEVTVVYEATQGFRHDVAGWRKDRVPTRPSGRKVTTRPDWVCEILSTNRRKDLEDKRRVLHAAGVPHYWLLDPDGLVLTVLRHHAEGYVVVIVVSPGERARLEPFDAVELDVRALFGDIAAGPPVEDDPPSGSEPAR